MGSISVPMGFTLQRPAFGVALDLRKKKQDASLSVCRRPSKIIASSLTTSQIDSNVLLKEETEFKSSFDEYLKAMESIRADRDKNKSQKGSHGRRKKLVDVAYSRDASDDQKHGESIKLKRFKGSDSNEEDEPRKRSHGFAGKGRVGESVQARNRIEKEANFVKFKDGSTKKLHVDSTAFISTKLVRNKSMPKSEMSTNMELGMTKFLFEQSELLDDVQDGHRVSRMEMEERIQNLAKSLDDADMDMPEWMFSKTMRSAKIRFSDHSIMRVIQILGKLGNWRRVLQVVEWLQMHERFKSHKIRYVYTAALDVLGKTRRPVEALNLFCAMQRHKASYPDIVAYHSIAVTLGQAGHMKELFDVIDSMRSMPKNFKIEPDIVVENWDPRLEPDIVVYNCVLNACAKRKEWEGAFWVLEKLAQVDQKPSNTTYGLVMEVMLACGKYDLVHEFFRQMKESSAPNALTYRVLVNTFWREGKPDEAIEAIQDMESQGIVGAASLYYDLARCLCSAGRCDEALLQVDKICKVASKPLVVTYTGLIQACFDGGNFHGGASIFNHMQKYCSPNLVTCNIMLKGYLGHGMFEEAKELFQKITQNGHLDSKVKGRIRPDVHTFNMMLEASIQKEKWDDFEYAYEQMLHHGHRFDTKRHLWMVLQASSAGKVEVVETTWRHLMQANRIPPPALIKERFRLKMENDNVEAAVCSVACHPSSHQQSFSKEAWLKLFEDNAHHFNKEALQQLICEVNTSLSKSKSPNLIYQNLLQSCMEFVTVRFGKPFSAGTDFSETPIAVNPTRV